MTGISEYFTAIAATALIGVLVSALMREERVCTILQLSTGVLLLLVVLKPVANLDLDRLSQQVREGFRREFSVADYESLYQDKLRSQIKGTTEEYIEKKATDIGGSVSAEVELSGEEYPTPIGVEIRGSLKGEQRVILQEYVTRDLGIPVEAQRWILYE